MSDALVSPEVGCTMWVVSASCIAIASKRIAQDSNESKIPLMGMMGAFVFAAQMINFSIPMTGSSGHLGGGILLAILLGPWGGLIAMSSILAIQALLFADGGLLAYGCNLFNMGVLPCLVVYPFFYNFIVGNKAHPSSRRVVWACMACSIISLQMGAFAVVLETFFSGISSLPFVRFIQLMQPIHLAIGLVEGAATAAVFLFLSSMKSVPGFAIPTTRKKGAILKIIAICSLITAGFFSWYASEHPDGLEWSIERTAHTKELEAPDNNIHNSLANFQSQTALLPDYAFPAKNQDTEEASGLQTSLSGILGASAVLLVLVGAGWGIRKALRRNSLPST